MRGSPRASVIYGGSAQRGLLTALGTGVDGLFLGRFAHDPVDLAGIIDEAAAARRVTTKGERMSATPRTAARRGRFAAEPSGVPAARHHRGVMAEGAVRIEELADRFGISLMTVHRDLDELEGRGLLRKSRGVATALSTALVESSDVYRSGRQLAEKEAIAVAALEFIEPGQAIMLDDSTTALHLVPHLHTKKPLTVITNTPHDHERAAGDQRRQPARARRAVLQLVQRLHGPHHDDHRSRACVRICS